MFFNQIHHIAIIGSDYERSKNFYTKVLGFTIINETYRSHRDSYKLDLKVNATTQIELFSFPSPPNRVSYPQEACGLRHLAFRVADIDTVIRHLNQYQVETEAIRIDEITGKKFTFFADPDGLPLEIYEE